MSVRCFKCNNDVAIVASREGHKKSYCRTCFLDSYHRNVRDTFFRQCRVPPDVPIILAVSGGMNSMALMHSMGLLRVQNIIRGGAGKINFDMHVMHLTSSNNNSETANSEQRSKVQTLVKACVAVAPIDHVPQATTTKRRVKQQKEAELNNNNTSPRTDATPAPATPLFEPFRVHVKQLSDYLPSYGEIDNTFFGTSSTPSGSSGTTASPPSFTKPFPSVAMAEDLVAQLRMKAIVAAARDVAAAVWMARKGAADVVAPADDTSNNSGANKHTKNANANGLKNDGDFLLLFGDSAVHSSVETLYNIIRGRGNSVVDHCGYRGSLFGGTVPVRRPLRGLLPKENYFYCRIEDIPIMWTAAPYPPRAVDAAPDNNSNRQLLEYCIASATVHRDLVHLLVQSIKRHHAGTPLAILSHKQKASVKQLLEHFVLNLSDGSYRSAIFNVVHSVDKIMGDFNLQQSQTNMGGISGDHTVNSKQKNASVAYQHFQQNQQFQYGPKTAHTFAKEGNGEVAVHCSLCGGSVSAIPAETGSVKINNDESNQHTSSTNWKWCRSCRQVLRPVFDAASTANTMSSNTQNDDTNTEKEKNELMAYLTVSSANTHDHPEGPLVKMSVAQIRAEIVEFLLDNDDDV